MKNLCLKWRKMMVGHTPVIAVRKQDPDYGILNVESLHRQSDV